MHVNKNKNEIYKQMVLQHLKFILFINESSPTMKLDFFNKHMIIRQVYINMPFSIYSEQNRKRTCVTLCTTTSSTTIQSIFSPLFPSPLSFSLSFLPQCAETLARIPRARTSDKSLVSEYPYPASAARASPAAAEWHPKVARREIRIIGLQWFIHALDLSGAI